MSFLQKKTPAWRFSSTPSRRTRTLPPLSLLPAAAHSLPPSPAPLPPPTLSSPAPHGRLPSLTRLPAALFVHLLLPAAASPLFSRARLPAPHASARHGPAWNRRVTAYLPRLLVGERILEVLLFLPLHPQCLPPAAAPLAPRASRHELPPRRPRRPPAPRESAGRGASPSPVWIWRAAAYFPRLLVGERILGLLFLPRRLPAGRGPCCARASKEDAGSGPMPASGMLGVLAASSTLELEIWSQTPNQQRLPPPRQVSVSLYPTSCSPVLAFACLLH